MNGFDVACWHNSDQPITAGNVRSLGVKRSCRLRARNDANDPKAAVGCVERRGSDFRSLRSSASLAHELGGLRLLAEFRPAEHRRVVLVVVDVWVNFSVHQRSP